SYVPVFTRARKIIVIHDVIADTYPQLTLPSATARMLWKAKVAAGLRQADAIVTVSDFSRDGIVQRFGIQPERIAVVGEASDPVFRRLPDASLTTHLRDLGVPEAGRLVVYVGGFSPHKNLEPLVDAVAALASRPGFEDIRLVMVGEHKREVFHSYFDVVARRVAAAGLTNRTIFTGYLADEDVVVLLNRSAVLALPSLIEGFGLPAVEAAACGCRVVATTSSPLPGLLGDGAICVDAREPSSLAAALEHVLGSEPLRASMRKAGLDAASRLTWEAAARQMRRGVVSVAARWVDPSASCTSPRSTRRTASAGTRCTSTVSRMRSPTAATTWTWCTASTHTISSTRPSRRSLSASILASGATSCGAGGAGSPRSSRSRRGGRGSSSGRSRRCSTANPTTSSTFTTPRY